MNANKTMITAHAGAENTVPNTLESIGALLSLNCEALEIDVRMAGGALRLGHDQATEGPLLADCLQLIKGGDKRLNCDMKESGQIGAVLALAEQCGMADRLIFTGEMPTEGELQLIAGCGAQAWMNVRHVSAMLERIKDYPTGDNMAAKPNMAALRSWLDTTGNWAAEMGRDVRLAMEKGFLYLNLCHMELTEGTLPCVLESGLKISAWTADTREEIHRLLSLGVANITTRIPETAIVARNALTVK